MGTLPFVVGAALLCAGAAQPDLMEVCDAAS